MKSLMMSSRMKTIPWKWQNESGKTTKCYLYLTYVTYIKDENGNFYKWCLKTRMNHYENLHAEFPWPEDILIKVLYDNAKRMS